MPRYYIKTYGCHLAGNIPQAKICPRIQANFKLLLLRNGYKAEEGEKILDLIYRQALSLFRDFVPSTA